MPNLSLYKLLALLPLLEFTMSGMIQVRSVDAEPSVAYITTISTLEACTSQASDYASMNPTTTDSGTPDKPSYVPFVDTPNGRYTDLGCYSDLYGDGGPFPLWSPRTYLDWSPVSDSAENCIATCSFTDTGEHFLYAGIEPGACWCANNLADGFEAPGQCDYPCDNTPNEFCGGFANGYLMEIYGPAPAITSLPASSFGACQSSSPSSVATEVMPSSLTITISETSSDLPSSTGVITSTSFEASGPTVSTTQEDTSLLFSTTSSSEAILATTSTESNPLPAATSTLSTEGFSSSSSSSLAPPSTGSTPNQPTSTSSMLSSEISVSPISPSSESMAPSISRPSSITTDDNLSTSSLNSIPRLSTITLGTTNTSPSISSILGSESLTSSDIAGSSTSNSSPNTTNIDSTSAIQSSSMISEKLPSSTFLAESSSTEHQTFTNEPATTTTSKPATTLTTNEPPSVTSSISTTFTISTISTLPSTSSCAIPTLQNGNFESGSLFPWTQPAHNEDAQKLTIVENTPAAYSGGYYLSSIQTRAVTLLFQPLTLCPSTPPSQYLALTAHARLPPNTPTFPPCTIQLCIDDTCGASVFLSARKWRSVEYVFRAGHRNIFHGNGKREDKNTEMNAGKKIGAEKRRERGGEDQVEVQVQIYTVCFAGRGEVWIDGVGMEAM